jgi:hypothetical protein
MRMRLGPGQGTTVAMTGGGRVHVGLSMTAMTTVPIRRGMGRFLFTQPTDLICGRIASSSLYSEEGWRRALRLNLSFRASHRQLADKGNPMEAIDVNRVQILPVFGQMCDVLRMKNPRSRTTEEGASSFQQQSSRQHVQDLGMINGM